MKARVLVAGCLLLTVVGFCCWADAVAAPALQIPETFEDGAKTVEQTADWFRQHHVRAAAAGLLALLLGLWRSTKRLFIDRVPRKALPFVVAGVAFLSTIPIALTTEPWSWQSFIWHAVLTSTEAIAFWSLGIKYIFRTLEKEKRNAATS